MSSARSGKVLVSFGAGEYTPDLDSRADLDNAQFAARTLKNFRTDIFGGAVRRAGLQFIAAAKVASPFTTTSLRGSGTMYGITEFADVSDPPRKYRQLESNRAGLKREATLSPASVEFTTVNRVHCTTAGVFSGLLNGSRGDLETASFFDADVYSFEDYDPSANGESEWTPYPPTWEKTKTAKHFLSPDTAPSETAGLRFYGQAFGREGGIVGSSRGISVTPAFVTDHWELTVRVQGDGASLGTHPGIACYARVISGNRDPGDVTSADFAVGASAATGSDPTDGSFVVNLPPDCSIRFAIQRGSTDIQQFPQQIGEVYDNGVLEDSGLTESSADGWLYFPATDTLVWKYEETLGIEDTMEDALLRGTSTPGTLATAETSAFTGGTSAESHDPIDFTATTVRVAYAFTGLTIGHRYSWTVTMAQNTIGDTDFSIVESDAFEFVATATSQPVEFLMIAPVGKQARASFFAITDEGVEPPPPAAIPTELLAWSFGIAAAGGTLAADSFTLASDLLAALMALSSYSKLKYFMPLLGDDLAAALQPLVDPGAIGRPTNMSFVDADFSQTTGLQGNGSSKALVTGFKPNALGSSNNGGCGWWELDLDTGGSGVVCLGAFDTAVSQFYGLIPFSGFSPAKQFGWSAFANVAGNNVSSGNTHLYGQRSSAILRELYQSGTLQGGSNTTSDAATGAGDNFLWLMGHANGPQFWAGRMGLAYFTDGSLTAQEIADLHAALSDFMTAAARS